MGRIVMFLGVVVVAMALSRPASASLQSFNGYACSVSQTNNAVLIEPRGGINCGGAAINQVYINLTGTYARSDVQMMGIYGGLVQALVAHKKIFFWYESTTGQIQVIYVYDQ